MSAALDTLATSTQSRMARMHGVGSFLAIGIGATSSQVLLSSLLVTLFSNVEAWVLSAGCYAALILPVYMLHRRFSFRSDAAHRTALPRYLTVQGMSLCLASLFGYVIYGTLALPTLVSAGLVAGLTSGVSFLVLRSWAFVTPTQAVAAT